MKIFILVSFLLVLGSQCTCSAEEVDFNIIRRVKRNTRNIIAVSEMLNSTTEELTGDILALNSLTTELNGVIEGVTGEVAVLTENNMNLEGEVATLRSEIEENNGLIANLTGEVVDLKGEVADLEGEVADLEGEVTVLEVEVAMIGHPQIQNHGFPSMISVLNGNTGDYGPYTGFDGDKRSECHTANNGVWYPWWKVTFPNDAVISRIVIYAKGNWNNFPINKHTVTVKDAVDNIVWEETIDSNVNIRILDYSLPMVTGQVVQLVANTNTYLNFGDVEIYGLFQYE